MSEMDRNNGGFAPFQSELEGGQEPLGQVDYSLETLLKKVKEHSPLSDMEKITKAYHFSEKAHEGQKRRSGEPYFIHPVTVAGILAELGMDTDSIVAGLLHDCLEDTSATYTTLEKEFGRSVADLVNGVTRLGKIVYSSKEEAQMEDLRKMFIAMARDIRVIIIKLADRLHNARTFQYLPEQKQRDKALETMEIYAPLAHRLGIQNIKWELEDISIKYLDPVGYGEIMSQMADKGQQYEDFLQGVKKRISEKLLSMGIPCEMKARVKHVYSIYRKMYTQNLNLSEIYDICAVRVIVEELADCYNVLGFIHDLYRPVPGRFKDYISTPKPNGYQSLHTVVIGREGIPFEVQIRTREMDRTAEYGVAAHWKYKDGLKGKQNEETFAWIRQLLESQQDTQAEDFIQNIKVDLFSDEVFVFTPKGDVINLPAGATPIDFAYAIHSGVGNAMVGAKVNNRIASYDQQLCNGDIVEVLTSKTAKGPSRDWLNICKSNGARTKIKQWFKKEKREENIVHGKASFEGEMRRANVNPAVLQDAELLPGLLKKLAFECLDDMYAAIGYGGLTAAKAFGRIRDELIRATRQTPAPPVREVQKQAEPGKGGRHKDSGVIVEDIDSCMIKFSRCCTPVPGDDIVGFITKGYGVSIHRRDCRNAAGASDPKQAGRWVKVAWSTEDKPFSTTFEIDSTDRSGIWLDIATALSAAKLKVTELSGRDMPTGKARTVTTFEVRNVQELETIRTKIRAIDGVIDVRRGQN